MLQLDCNRGHEPLPHTDDYTPNGPAAPRLFHYKLTNNQKRISPLSGGRTGESHNDDDAVRTVRRSQLGVGVVHSQGSGGSSKQSPLGHPRRAYGFSSRLAPILATATRPWTSTRSAAPRTLWASTARWSTALGPI